MSSPLEDEDFIAEIHANVHDETPRLVYADWLEDQGDPRAEYVRLECDLAGLQTSDALYAELHPRLLALREQMPPDWLAKIARSRVRNCYITQCPGHWHRLRSTPVAAIRICEECQSAIRFTKTVDEAVNEVEHDRKFAADSYLPGDVLVSRLRYRSQRAAEARATGSVPQNELRQTTHRINEIIRQMRETEVTFSDGQNE